MSKKYSSNPSKLNGSQDALNRLIGLGPRSMQKSYYPELKARLDELTRFRNLLDNINDLIILIDIHSGLIIDTNKATETLLGLHSGQILKNPLSTFMDKSEADKILNFFQQEYICSKLFRVQLITSNRKLIPVEINCKIVKLKPNGYGVLIARNMTAQEEARQEIEIQRAFFRQLFDNSPKAIVMEDELFCVADVNKAFVSLFGYTIQEVVGTDINSFITPDHLSEEVTGIKQQAYKGITQNMQTRRTTSSGQTIDVDILCIPVTFGGRFNGLFSIFTDITQKLQIEINMSRQQKLESIALLAGGLAHDFNNILSVILANTSLSKIHAAHNKPLKESLNRIENASSRAKDLTMQLLTFAKGGEPVKKTIDLRKVLQETVKFALSGSSTRVVFHIDDDLMPIYADEGQISQVVQNLTINASQAMPEKGLLNIFAGNMALGKENDFNLASGKYVYIKFKDTGPGITAEDLTRIFDPYFTTKKKGSGLGLAITYSIIRKHQGHIHVSSTPGEGAEFFILIEASDSLPEDSASYCPLKKVQARVMIMDDESDILEVTSEYLEAMGYEVVTARDGHQAMRKFEQYLSNRAPIDILVTDLTIPGGMGGRELSEKLLGNHPTLPIIVTSGYAHDEAMADYSKFGFAARIIKPFSIEELDHLIRQCLAAKSVKQP
ncbi:PAS domain-containing hybrid sensor histidine kinase/response regulator [Desulfonatronovibrio magnus]|uniref:PAS domain-containing hybrid sensor histidine kinase/response regulator n=1 Tax=Desulfonatronovibrio magnus TaxID=698827 RepID=UPI000696E28F|nr:PAS domain-containing sensor histidine kinase [Desulfonatronovibrio magnus]